MPTISDLETELDAAENAGRRGCLVWPWLVAAGLWIVWRNY